jgi:hypothetical protein
MAQDKPNLPTTKKQKPATKKDNFLPPPRRTFWIGTARGFLEYFRELAEPEQAKLGFSLREPDWQALYHLSIAHCLVTQEWGADFAELYNRRRTQARTLYKHVRLARYAINQLRRTIAEIETWQQARFPGAKPFPSTSPESIGKLYSVESELESLEPTATHCAVDASQEWMTRQITSLT